MDSVDNTTVLKLLQSHPDGLTVREVAAKLDVEFTVAQNALRQLHMSEKADVTTPTRLDESKKWVAT